MNLIKFFLLIGAVCLSIHPSIAQKDVRVGEWKTYLSHRSAVQSVEKDGIIYTLTKGGMTTYDESTKEIKTYSTIEGLSGINPTAIYLDEGLGEIFIGYEDGTINYFSDPSEINYLTEIQRNRFFTRKRIYQFSSSNGRLFVATDFGIAVYNIFSKLTEITITQIGDNPSKEPVPSISVAAGSLFATVSTRGLYSIKLNSLNLSDPTEWAREDGFNGLPGSPVYELAARGNELFARLDSSVYKRKGTTVPWTKDPILSKTPMDHLSVFKGVITASRNSRTLIFEPSGVRQISTTGRVKHALVYNDLTFLSEEFNGLLRHETGNGFENIAPPGPKNNNSTRVVAGNGEFYIAPKGYDDAYGPVGDASGIYHHNTETGTWKILNRIEGTLPLDIPNDKFARAFYNEETRVAYLGSWGEGMVSLKDGEILDAYDCSNSGLSFITGNSCDLTVAENTRVSGITQDEAGNLWVCQSFSLNPLTVMKPDGEWVTFPGTKFPGANMIDMIVDDYGSKWILNRKNGVIVFNENGDIDNFNNDIVVQLKSGLNRGDLPSDNVFSIAKDQDGFIWVGTDVGVTVFFDPFSISKGSVVDASCPVFELRCLLKDERVNAIAVDGGNRKWMGTNNGVFLVSEDGNEVIFNFTTENSPLLSNSVLDVTIDGSTGEVFIATEKGLISYAGDATTGSEDCNDVLVFPNPVFSDFDGVITIRGSAPNSIVKITTVSGLLVKEIEANGGSATWDGADIYGNRVASGIYLALIANEDGEKACVGKFAVINR